MDRIGKFTCRICMENCKEPILIFEKEETYKKTFAEMLTNCTKCTIDELDVLPKHICHTCSIDVQNAFSFKEKAEKSQKNFIEIMNVEFNITKNSENQHEEVGVLEKSTQTELNEISKRLSSFCSQTKHHIDELVLLSVDKQPNYQLIDLKTTACPICQRSFSRKDLTKEHILRVHNDDPKKYFPTRHGIKLKILKCPVCNRKFSRMEHVRGHIQRVHKQDPNIVLEQVTYSTEKTAEKDVLNNDAKEKDPISSDIESNKDLVDSLVNSIAAIKDEPEDGLDGVKLEIDEQIIVKVEPTQFYSFDNEDFGDQCNETPNVPADYSESESAISIDNDSEPLITIKNAIVQRRHGSGEGTPQERTCQLCQRLFSRLCHLRRHMQTVHTEEKPYSCPHCEKRFARSDRLKNHIEGVHATEKTYKCDICEKAFSRKEGLQRHKKTPHGVTSSFDCEICERKFSQKRFLVRHQLLHSDRILACRFCEETFKDRKLYTEHERGHKSNTKDFLCSICGESFGRIDYLRIHVQRHLGEKPHKCQYCDKGFIRKSDLNEHLRYHTNTKPNVCKICGKAFVRRSKLTIHMRIHTGEKPYTCEYCPKSFAQRNDLKAHVRRHTGERFRCDQCDAAFLQLYGLRQHALNAHGKVMESRTGRLKKV